METAQIVAPVRGNRDGAIKTQRHMVSPYKTVFVLQKSCCRSKGRVKKGLQQPGEGMDWWVSWVKKEAGAFPGRSVSIGLEVG